MENSVTSQFVILSLHPETGRIIMDNIRFRYSLTGALLMDFLDSGEISLDERRLVPSFKMNGDPMHDQFAERIQNSLKRKRISFWVRRFSGKSRFIFNETIRQLINKGALRHEKRYFLNIIPYNRYFFSDIRIRTEIIEDLRNILLHDKSATRKQSMLLGLIKASGSYHILAKERTERRMLRNKCNEFLKKDVFASEIDKAIREVQAAVIASVTAASVASGSH
jgi:hypothetical protein